MSMPQTTQRRSKSPSGNKRRPPLSGAERILRDLALCQDYQSGMTMHQVADKHGVNVSTVSHAVRNAGLRGRKHTPPKRTPDDLVAEVLRLNRAGATVREIRRATGVNRYNIYGQLKRAGLKPNTPPRERTVLTDAKLAQARGMLAAEPDIEAEALARHVGINDSTLRRAMPELKGRQHAARDALDLKIVAEYRRGADGPTLAKAHNVSLSRIYAALTRRKVKARPGATFKPMTDDYIRRILALHAKGLTPLEIQEKTGMRRSSVYKALRRRGVIPHTLRARKAQPDVC